DRDIPFMPPVVIDGRPLFAFAGSRFCLFRRFGGRAPALDAPGHLLMLGRLVGRQHAVGAMRPFEYRPELSVQAFGHDSLAWLREHDCVPESLRPAYFSVADDLLARVEEFCQAHPHTSIR